MKKGYRLIFKICALALTILVSGCNFSDKKTKTETPIPNDDTYDRDELSLQRGNELFNQHCASCHSFVGNEIGPSLNGVTAQVDKEWLISFIKDPKTMVTNGDQRAVELFEKYKLYMPSFPNLENEEIEDLLSFIHKFSEAEKKNVKARSGALLNPITDKIPTSDLSLVIEEWLTIPPSSDSDPLARINKLSAIKTSEGERMFIADLRGKLYEIVNDTVQVYLDFNEEEENFMDNPGWGTGLGSFDFHPDFESNGLFIPRIPNRQNRDRPISRFLILLKYRYNGY